MALTYEPIATQTLGSTTVTVTFNSIPNTYTDLRLVFVPISSGGFNFDLRYNNQASVYNQVVMYGDGSSAESQWRNDARFSGIGTFGTIPSLHIVDVFSYAGSTRKTSIITQSGDRNGTGYVGVNVLLYDSTTAISRIDLESGFPWFSAGSTFTLYGIKNA
jgi:hypothetical protein